MARNKYPEETVQKILDVSLKLFLEQGYEETTILEIVSQLGGLSRGAFYHHFKSKEAVLDALGDRLFFENNPFETVKNERGLNGLEKIQRVLKLTYQNSDQQKINSFTLPLLANPRLLSDYLENNQQIVAPLFEDLFAEAILDGSIKTNVTAEPFASLFVLVANVWLVPSITQGTKEQLIERLYFAKELFDKLGAPIIDQDLLADVTASLDQSVN